MTPYGNIWNAQTPFGQGAAQQWQQAGMQQPVNSGSIFNNPIATRGVAAGLVPQAPNYGTPTMQQMKPPLSNFQPGFGGGVMPGQWPGYQLPTMGNIRNPFQYGNQPINPVGDVLGNPGAPQQQPAGGMDQAQMMKALHNWQNAQNTQASMYDGGGVGQGQYGNMVDRFAKDPKLMQGWADNSLAGRMLGDPWRGY